MMRQDGWRLAPSVEGRESDAGGRMLQREKSRKGRKGRQKRTTERGVGEGLGDRPRLDIKGNGGKQEQKGRLQ